jgi:hypothetical protein
MRDHAREAFDAGDSISFLLSTDNRQALPLVFYNVVQLRRRGIYATALLHAVHRGANQPLWLENCNNCALIRPCRSAPSPIRW